MQNRDSILRELQQLARDSARINQRIADIAGGLLEQPDSTRAAAPPGPPERPTLHAGPALSNPIPNDGLPAANHPRGARPATPPQPRPNQVLLSQPNRGFPVHPNQHDVPRLASPTPTVSLWQRDDIVTKLLAVAGGGITLIGLVFLAMVAYNSGILTPTNSVVLAAVACLASFLLGLRARSTSPAGNTAPALIVVAVLGWLADLWVTVFRFQWITPITGAVLTATLCVVGLAVAYHWQHEKLAVIVTALAPLFILPVGINVLTGNSFHVAFSACILFVALAAFAARWGRPWHSLHVAASAVYVVGTLTTWNQPRWTLLACTIGIVVLMIFAYDQPPMRTESIAASWVAVLGGSTLATLWQAPEAPIYFAIAFGAVTMWVFSRMKTLRQELTENTSINMASAFYTSAGCLGAVLFASLMRDDSSVLYASAFVLLAAGLTWCAHVTDIRLTAVMTGVALYVLAISAIPVLTRRHIHAPEDAVLPEGLIVLTIGLFLFTAMYARPVIFAQLSRGWAAIMSTTCLILASAYVPAAMLTVSPSTTTFMIAHLVISVVWISIGFVLLMKRSYALTSAGLLFVGVAVAKLILFDLSVLGGAVQVLAFMICGPLLLVAAFNRERWGSRPDQSSTRPHPSLEQSRREPQQPQRNSPE